MSTIYSDIYFGRLFTTADKLKKQVLTSWLKVVITNTQS